MKKSIRIQLEKDKAHWQKLVKSGYVERDFIQSDIKIKGHEVNVCINNGNGSYDLIIEDKK